MCPQIPEADSLLIYMFFFSLCILVVVNWVRKQVVDKKERKTYQHTLHVWRSDSGSCSKKWFTLSEGWTPVWVCEPSSGLLKVMGGGWSVPAPATVGWMESVVVAVGIILCYDSSWDSNSSSSENNGWWSKSYKSSVKSSSPYSLIAAQTQVCWVLDTGSE